MGSGTALEAGSGTVLEAVSGTVLEVGSGTVLEVGSRTATDWTVDGLPEETVQTSHSPGWYLAIHHVQLCIYTLFKPTARVHSYIISASTLHAGIANVPTYPFHNNIIILEHVNGWSYLAMDCDEIVSCACTCIML